MACTWTMFHYQLTQGALARGILLPLPRCIAMISCTHPHEQAPNCSINYHAVLLPQCVVTAHIR